MKINTKLFLIFIFFSIVVLPISIYIFDNFINNIEQERFTKYTHTILEERNKEISSFLTHLDKTILAISSNKIFKEFLKHEDNERLIFLEELFKTIAMSDGSIYQIRYIDKSGQEIIKVISDNNNIVINHNLQNKKASYYFKAIIKQPINKIWYSKMDLNMENSKIEKPIKPVIRIGLNTNNGILIINMLLKKLDVILQNKYVDFCLIDKDFYPILSTKHPEFNWARYLYPEVRKKVRFLFKQYSSIATPLLFKNGDEATLHLAIAQNNFSNALDKYKYAYIKLLIILMLLAYFFLRPFYKLSEQLEDTVRIRTKELYELNQNLQKTVEKEVEKNKLQQEKLQQEKIQNTKLTTIGLLSAGITHEINTPLTYIKGNFEMLMSDIELIKDEKLKNNMLEDAQQIKDGIDRISNIVESMRQMSSSSDDNKKESINIYNTLLTALTLGFNKYKHVSKIYINGERFSLDTLKDQFDFYSFVQPQKIEQVWIIIVNNAIDELVKIESFEDRRLDITISATPNNIIIRFKDNAGGIDPTIIDKIFEPLVSTKDFGGIGLGLNIAQKIINENEGKIVAFNEENGAVFEVILERIHEEK